MKTDVEKRGKALFFLISFLLLFLCVPQHLSGQVPLNKKLDLYGDVRFGYFGQERNERDGSKLSRHELRLRSRVGLRWNIHPFLEARVRYAGRFSSKDPAFKPDWTTTAVRNNGLQLGELALDEAYLQYRPKDHTYVRAGRFVTSYTLPGVIQNGIIRNDSPNNEVQWTDGFMASYRTSAGWTTDLVIQFHYDKWPSNTMRYPLDFGSGDSFLTAFASVRRASASGRIRLAGIDATISPNSLWLREGKRSHYAAISAKIALGWDTNTLGDIVWGSEAAWSLIRPDKAFLDFPEAGSLKAGGLGVQSNLSFIDFRQGHNLGFIFTALQPSLLTSEDYWNNILLWEVRYIWRINRRLSTEIRLRNRSDLQQFVNTARKRNEYVPYARLTYRFN